MLLMQFDPTVDILTPQPVTIPYQDGSGQQLRYTPDALVEWRKDLKLHDYRPLLIEVKYREAFEGEWRVWRRRFRAARNFAHSKGWVFQVLTEREIRTPFLENARFLLPYLNRSVQPETEQWVLDKLAALTDSTPQGLISSLYQDKWNQASLIPVVWRLLAERRIGCDLTVPLSMSTAIWSLWPLRG